MLTAALFLTTSPASQKTEIAENVYVRITYSQCVISVEMSLRGFWSDFGRSLEVLEVAARWIGG